MKTQKTLDMPAHPWLFVGAKVVLVGFSRERGGEEYELFAAEQFPDGIPGNMNAAICRFHGWRGTSYGTAITAYGLRRVIRVRPIAGGIRVTVGPDIAPDRP